MTIRSRGNSIGGRASITSLPANSKTSFGDLITANITPVVSGEAVYGFIPSNFREFTNASGTTGVSGNLFQVTTGTSVGGYGAIQSFRSLNYRVGLGAIFRFSAIFDAGVANYESGVGAGNIGNDLSFGYNGTDFGIWHRYHGKAEIRTLSITGAASGSEDATVEINDTEYTVPLTNATAQVNAKEIADYLTANGSGINADQLDDTVIVSFTSDGPKTGDFAFTSSTATATWAQTTAGVTKTSDFVTQADWNGTLSFDFDPTQGNVYQIDYQNGFGDIEFFIENPDDSSFELVHTIKWANNNTQTNVSVPSLRCLMYCASFGSTTDLSVRSAYLSSFTTGDIRATRNPRAFSNTKTSVGTTRTNLLTIRNKRIYNGVFNQVEIEPRYLTLANDGNKQAIFEIRGNPTVAGNVNFQDTGTNLVSEYDTTGTTVTADGRLLASFTVARLSSIQVSLSELLIRQPPTLRLVITGRMSSNTGDLTAALVWYEDV